MRMSKSNRLPRGALVVALVAPVVASSTVGCSDDDGSEYIGGNGGNGGTVEVPNPLTNPEDGPPAGNQNAEATCDIPAEAGLVAMQEMWLLAPSLARTALVAAMPGAWAGLRIRSIGVVETVVAVGTLVVALLLYG